MAYTQDNRLIAIDTPLGKDALLLQGFSGQEGISQLFRFQLDLLAERKVEPSKLIGQPVAVTLRLADGSARYFNGFVSRFVQGEEDTRFVHYQAEMVPWLWFLTQTADCRIFQNLSIPEIIEKVFKDLGFTDFKNLVQGVSEPREYCVQYRETDFNFVSRLMEQYGIFYFFEHTRDKHTLVLANAPAAHQPCPTQATARFEFVAQTAEPEDVVTNWTCEQEFRPGKYTLRDFSFETPSTTLEGTIESTLGIKDGTKFELYDYPGEFEKKPAGETLAKVRIEEEEASHIVVHGASTCRAFAAGYRFDLQGYVANQDGAYVLTEVQHMASVGDTYLTDSEATADEEYSNHFSCIPHRVPYRPPRLTPRPTVMGTQTAIVVGKKGEEIWSDKYGRVKVQFHWDREGKQDENSSCWIRVVQNWSGKRWGTVFLPRVGHEVVVDFLEGDPDRPIIVGSVYNAEQMPPYPLPDEQTKSTIKSHSSKGGDGFNEVRFEDKKGKEQIFVHAERNQDSRVQLDSLEWVGNNRHLIVAGDQLEQVKADKHLHVLGDQNEKVDGTLSLEAQERHEKVGMKHALDAGIELHMKAGMNLVFESSVNLTLKVGGNFININPAGIFIQAGLLMLNAGGAAVPGSGASPSPPKDPLEADKAEAGEGSAVPAPAPVTPGKVSPQALALRQAARTGAPFCEKCAAAAYAAAIAAGATPAEAAAAAERAGLAGAQAEPSEAELLQQARGPAVPGAGPPPALQSETELTWIEVALVDENEKPVAGEPYRIIFPDGTPRDGNLDEEGRVLLRGIPRGIYKVSFPRRDEAAWEEIDTDSLPPPAAAAEGGEPESVPGSEAEARQGSEADARQISEAEASGPTGAEVATTEIELVDEDGVAVAGAKFRVVFADGSKREGQLDPQGRARLEGVPAGPCTVSFLDIGARS
jgi:type VI secretion system secreted protein VgrG